MKFYRRTSPAAERKHRIMMRLLYLIIVAAVITFGSIIIGQYLIKKTDEANKLLDGISTGEYTPTTEQFEPSTESSFSDVPSVYGTGLDLADYSDSTSLCAKLVELADYYDTVMLNICDADGKLLYLSPAVCEAARQPYPEDAGKFILLEDAVKQANAIGMRLCASITASSGSFECLADAAAVDAVIISELSSLGFDEVLITLPSSVTDNLDYFSASDIRSYLGTCAAASGSLLVGVLLPDTLYLSVSDAKQVQMIASAAEFMALSFTIDDVNDTTAGIYRSITANISSLFGSFSMYAMRVIISVDSGDRTLINAEYSACREAGITNICFEDTVMPTDLTYDGGTIVDEEEENPVVGDAYTEGTSNPYASTNESYEEAAAEAAEEAAEE